MKLRGLFIAAAVLLMPTAALAAPGIVTTMEAQSHGESRVAKFRP